LREFDFTERHKLVVIDLTHAHFWDITAIALPSNTGPAPETRVSRPYPSSLPGGCGRRSLFCKAVAL
jgi:hypothetical protein